MEWSQPSRNVGFARGIALDLHAGGHLRCVWSGGKLTAKALDIDHCLPWSAWPCEDLWNLLPAHPSINRHQKRQRLPSAAALHAARALILDWWNAAYVRRDEATRSRFLAEATSSLPVQPGGLDDLEAIFAGLAARRTAL